VRSPYFTTIVSQSYPFSLSTFEKRINDQTSMTFLDLTLVAGEIGGKRINGRIRWSNCQTIDSSTIPGNASLCLSISKRGFMNNQWPGRDPEPVPGTPTGTEARFHPFRIDIATRDPGPGRAGPGRVGSGRAFCDSDEPIRRRLRASRVTFSFRSFSLPRSSYASLPRVVPKQRRIGS